MGSSLPIGFICLKVEIPDGLHDIKMPLGGCHLHGVRGVRPERHPGSLRILWYSLVFFGIRWYSLVFVGIRWYSLVFVGIRWLVFISVEVFL